MGDAADTTVASRSEPWQLADVVRGQDDGDNWLEPESTHLYASTEFLITWGLKPGDTLIGSAKFKDSFFFPQDPDCFPHQSAGEFGDLKHYGVAARLGWENPDGTGGMLSGFWIFDQERTVGPGRKFFGSDYSQLSTLASIPLDDGGSGQVVPFDSKFQQSYDQQAIGADADLYLAPFLDRQHVKFRFLFGAKYLKIHEQLQIAAGDSGLGYVVDLSTCTIDTSTVTDIGIPPYEMSLFSQTTTQLVGPQIGVRYDFGNDDFRIWGQTKLAVAANMERTQISGANVVNGFTAFALNGPAFALSNSTTHVSPILDTSIYGDFALLAAIPGVKYVDFLRRARFRVGFDYILVSEIARPANIIVWNEVNPQLKSNRTVFSLKTLSLGINWNF